MENTQGNTHPDLRGLSLMVVDDDHNNLRTLGHVFQHLGASVTGWGSLRQARLSLRFHGQDAIVSNFRLKDGTGLDLLPDYQARCPEGSFYLTGDSRFFNVDPVDSLKQGIRGYFKKPVDPIELANRLVADLASKTPAEGLAKQLAPYLILQDPVMAEALAELPSFAVTSEPVLIQGETGTGKELVAKALHGLGSHAEGPFVAVNCGAIPENLLEAELFGYEKGAFTGANRMHKGYFEQAHQGTLFLDEIGEMPPSAQISLLRILEEGKLQRLGAEGQVRVNIRVVAATHRSLEELVEARQFRSDLFYRLNVLPLFLPPLRERPADIALLAERFLADSLRDRNWQSPIPCLSIEAKTFLQYHGWSGNVRELRNVMARLAVRLTEDMREIPPKLLRSVLRSPSALPSPFASGQEGGIYIPKGTTLTDAEWLLIDAALQQSAYNRSQAARLLGIGERTLRRKLNES
ncbi:Two component, sigma54 specific, transcriptional regulator, Fis family [Candidatus Methylobacter favarea]|uniref:Two component, sigma54 specific, transcriptional regulator, Fis family n=1 Tax=Candidatus Methylobacter favarea TaxID=2707345 RepID=A0A8S0Y8R1_9GAMM|nr:sigma-54 dependent transcriptional regulator [Candidatus Methylobacter favarea]CAA9889194.1 Two component, sigma54 specific, transcriptional regulator, Fis family [Candidatus Methylobacter favarea]